MTERQGHLYSSVRLIDENTPGIVVVRFFCRFTFLIAAMLASVSRCFFVKACRLPSGFQPLRCSSAFPGLNSDLRGDGAIRRTEPLGSTIEQTYAGVLSFLRRKYTRNLDRVDVAVTGIPLDLATTYRSGTRFGAKGIREASVQFAELKSYPGGVDLFEDLAVIDYGDCWFDQSQPKTVPKSIEDHARQIIDRNVFLLSLGESRMCHVDEGVRIRLMP